MSARSPTFYILFSVATSLITMALKTGAYLLTGSVGLLSDALESGVNLAAALVALATLSYAHSGEDDDHNFGHEKAEYFSSGIEGALIFVAAAAIIWSAVPRLASPRPLEQVGVGLALSVLAAGANLLCGWFLLKGAREHRSITLEADAHHLLTDVWTTVGVIAGVAVVHFTGWLILDPVIAIAVAVQILWTGWSLIRRSFDGLMDRSIPADERKRIAAILEQVKASGGDFHRLRTRVSGKKSFVDVHILVPGSMSVHDGHDLAHRLEKEIEAAVPHVEALTHIEPLEDPRSWDDPDNPLAGS
ncbi:MAG TPA: cation diffusion facilitator family transporter [Usitatibacteraceae bacterium]|nr:cation diffusion facilitator family transporter [Usitatibacteraceae bacterium]